MSVLTKFRNLLAESLGDHWKLIVGFYLIFIIVSAAAWIISANTINANYESINQTIHASNSTSTNMIPSGDAVGLFTHNVWGGIVTYVGSVFFAIPAIVMLFFNAFNLGTLGPIFSMARPGGDIQYLIYIIPHGIFEITSTVLQSVAGVLLFIFILKFVRAFLKTREFSDAYEQNKKILIHSLVIMIFSAILLLIAAPIEAYFSVPFSDFVMGL